jgi:hypothetical protein
LAGVDGRLGAVEARGAQFQQFFHGRRKSGVGQVQIDEIVAASAGDS